MPRYPKRVNIVTGHYGSGKTNLAINLAFDLRRSGKEVCLVDLDIVNPYFRAADLTGELEKAGVRVIAPAFANTNLDIPALPPEVNSVFDDRSRSVILDVGGDDAGALALGVYANSILKENDYCHLYVINARRALTQSPQEAVDILKQIETACRVPVTGVVNNTNLARETDAQTVLSSLDYMKSVNELSGLETEFTSVSKEFSSQLEGLIPRVYPVEIYIKTLWDNSKTN